MDTFKEKQQFDNISASSGFPTLAGVGENQDSGGLPPSATNSCYRGKHGAGFACLTSRFPQSAGFLPGSTR